MESGAREVAQEGIKYESPIIFSSVSQQLPFPVLPYPISMYSLIQAAFYAPSRISIVVMSP